MFFLGVVVVVGIIGLIIVERHTKREKLSRFKERNNIPEEEFYNKFYLSSGLPKDLVLAALREVAEVLELPQGLLRPDDRFDREFAPVKGSEMDDPRYSLETIIYSKLKKLDSNTNLSTIHTLDDLIRRLVTAQMNSPPLD